MDTARPDETPAMMIANDIMAIKVTGRWDDFHDIAQAAINIAIKAEREACAALVDNLHSVISRPYTDPNPAFNNPEAVRNLDANLVSICAAAIRDRS